MKFRDLIIEKSQKPYTVNEFYCVKNVDINEKYAHQILARAKPEALRKNQNRLIR